MMVEWFPEDDSAFRPSIWLMWPRGWWLVVFYGYGRPSLVWVPRA